MDKQPIADIISKEVQQIVMRKVPDDQPLLSTRILDSMGLVDLAMALEMAFHIKINARDVTPLHFETIHAMTDYISKAISR